jgi:hypothetical protein
LRSEHPASHEQGRWVSLHADYRSRDLAMASSGAPSSSAADTLVSLAWAQAAAKTVKDNLAYDANLPELGKLVARTREPHSYTYRPYTDEELAPGGRPVLWRQQVFSLGFHRAPPQRVRELAGEEGMASLRGLWPEIHRAWASVDDRLVIWNYEAAEEGAAGGEDGDWEEIADLGHPITAVGLVVPRPDFFIPAIKVRGLTQRRRDIGSAVDDACVRE